MNLQLIKDILAKAKPDLQSKYPISSMAIFGSYARGEENERSDVDILVDFNGRIGMGFIRLAFQLEDMLNMKVDLVSKRGVKPRYFEVIKDDLVYV